MRTLTFIILIISPSLIWSQGQFSVDTPVNDFLKTYNDLQGSLFAYDAAGTLIAQPNLFDEFDFNSSELLSTNLTFKDDKTSQKIVFAPLKLSSNLNVLNSFIANTRINLNLKGGITTIGVGIGGDTSNPYREKWLKTFADDAKVITNSQPRQGGESMDAYLARTKIKDKLDEKYIEWNKSRLAQVWKWSLGYNVQLFSVIGASGDGSDNFDSLNAFNSKAHAWSVSGTYAIDNYRLSVVTTLNLLNARASAVEVQEMQRYFGPSVTAKYRIVSLIKEDKLKKNKDYIKSLFVPSIYFGIAYEARIHQGNEAGLAFVIDGVENLYSTTFFIDFTLSPASQFRIGIPRIKQELVDQESLTSLGAILQYNFKLVNLN